MKHRRKWARKNRIKSSLAMSRKEEKQALVSSHTQPLKDFGETNAYIFMNRSGVRVLEGYKMSSTTIIIVELVTMTKPLRFKSVNPNRPPMPFGLSSSIHVHFAVK